MRSLCDVCISLPCVSWLQTTDRSRLLCANRQYWLLGNSNVQWPVANCDLFLDALVYLWNNWST